MDSTLLLAISLPASMLILLLCLWLILRSVRLGRAQNAQQWNLVIAAVLKTSLSSTTEATTLLAKLSEDNRSATVALTNAARESLQLQQTSAREMTEMAQANASRISQQATLQAAQLLQSTQSHSASLTSMLATTIKLLGTRDGIAYAQVSAADRSPEQATGPYTTGDEDEIARRQAEVDAIFDGIRTGDEDGGARSDLADFGLYGN